MEWVNDWGTKKSVYATPAGVTIGVEKLEIDKVADGNGDWHQNETSAKGEDVLEEGIESAGEEEGSSSSAWEKGLIEAEYQHRAGWMETSGKSEAGSVDR